MKLLSDMNGTGYRQCRQRALQALLLLVALLAMPALAQTPDSEPPVVGLDSDTESVRGEMQKFTVTATDNQSIDSIVFFYRIRLDADPSADPDSNELEPEYVSGDMIQVDQTDRYTFTVNADDIGETAAVIEYYIEAKDEAGNRTLQGFFFDPLKRTLLDKSAVMMSENQSSEPESSSLLGSLSTTEKVLYGAVGVVVVGALIALAAGGDSSDNDDTQAFVPVTIIGTPPPLTRP